MEGDPAGKSLLSGTPAGEGRCHHAQLASKNSWGGEGERQHIRRDLLRHMGHCSSRGSREHCAQLKQCWETKLDPVGISFCPQLNSSQLQFLATTLSPMGGVHWPSRVQRAFERACRGCGQKNISFADVVSRKTNHTVDLFGAVASQVVLSTLHQTPQTLKDLKTHQRSRVGGAAVRTSP